MFFCPNCNNAFDISKDSVQMQYGGAEFESLIKAILNSDAETTIKKLVDTIDIDKFIKSSDYKKLGSTDKELVFNRVQDALPVDKKLLIQTKTPEEPDTNAAYFVCKNCIYNVKILDGTKLYSKTSEDISSGYKVENMDMKIHSSILPITRKYVCPNDKCLSHTDPFLKEAIIFRSTSSFSTTYICKTCKVYWGVSN